MNYNEAMWRPSQSALAKARLLIHAHPSPAIRRRVVILDALAAAPNAPTTEIARAASTRTRVIRQLLHRWQTEGLDSLTRFGRPVDLDAATLLELKRAIPSIPLRSLAEVGSWLTKQAGLKFSQPTLRSYCRRLGLNLPAKYKPPKPVKPERHRRKWTSRQVADLQQHKSQMSRRITALLRLGSESAGSINDVARECRVPASTLRLDVQRFEQGGAKAVVSHLRRDNLLRRSGVWITFTDWCREQHQQSGACPSARLAVKYLWCSHGIRMPVRTVYTHLTRWRREAGLPLRRWRIRDKFTPI